MRVLVTGATGFIGELLTRRLLDDGFDVRCLVRDDESPAAEAIEAAGCELAVADLTRPAGLAAALDGVGAAYFLVHMIDGGEDYPAIEQAAAGRFGRAARAAGVEPVIYLGGLGDEPASKHLAARHEAALALAAEGPPLTYFRAAMVIGAGSESYELLRAIVERVPALLPPPSGSRPRPSRSAPRRWSTICARRSTSRRRRAARCRSAGRACSPISSWSGDGGGIGSQAAADDPGLIRDRATRPRSRRPQPR